jgi:8-oxo-dGTP pyrophosphatase MutT (NUDIX family)
MVRQPVQVLIYPARAMSGDWEYLLLRRTASRGGFWQGVTGGVEEGEGIPEAARREFVEETGLVPVSMHRLGYSYAFPVEDRWRHLYAEGVREITEHVFVAQVDDRQAPAIDPDEHDQWGWFGLDRALELLAWPENIEALRRCADTLRERRNRQPAP